MLLVVNAGSSSLKVAVFDAGLQQRASGRVTEIGAVGRLELGRTGREVRAQDHLAALDLALTALQAEGIGLSDLTAAAHRVVHGGATLTHPTRITPQVEAEIAACIPLAPLHNPANLTAITALRTLAPALPQYASFDTAFHATNPPVATRYALPAEVEGLGLRRYGFHGISYASLVGKMRDLGPLPDRLLALHLGNGASLCAILGGRSVATTMGYSPLSGITMGTRTGDIDGNAVLRLAEVHGVEGASRILNRASGLLGLAGTSDMRDLHARAMPEARFAVDYFCYWVIRHAGSMIAAMGGLDAIAFTGGIGENDGVVRQMIVEGLAWAGRTPVVVIPAEEERHIASEALALMPA